MQTRGMYAQQPVEWIAGTDVTHDFGPVARLIAIIVWKSFHLIPGQIGFAGSTPDHGPCAIARDEITPMLLHFLHARGGNIVAPRAKDAGRQALVDQIVEAIVGRVEILRTNAGVVRSP